MSTSEFSRIELEDAIIDVKKGGLPTALELNLIKKLRSRIRKEDIATAMQKYNAYASVYAINILVKSVEEKPSLRRRLKVFNNDVNFDSAKEGLILSGCSSIVFITISLFSGVGVFPVILFFMFINIFFLMKILNIKFIDELRLVADAYHNELRLIGPQYMIDEIMPNEIHAAMERWILSKEQEEIESATAQDVLDVCEHELYNTIKE
ncbi:hypothetical protein CMI47_13000 [Candidatus Pacearchaeota archaeon]|nr:hypothetical protein [Candidatus Pacearchaeota archaeon]|tara:strand:- start:131 stop:754 length:624 start_codon:yes stop_codon:yes gene_type:complete